MNDSHPNNKPVQGLGVAALLRCAADGELTAEQQALLDAHLKAHPEDAARIRFERELRGACARAMDARAAAPAGLRDLIAARVAQSAAPAPQPEVVVVGRVGRTFGRARSWASLAAVLVLSGTGIALLVRGGMLAQQQNGETTSAAVVLTNFLSGEHQSCASSTSALASKLKVTDATRAPEAIQKILGRPVSVESMAAAGFEFVGAGGCKVPGAEKSVHLMFRRLAGSGKHKGTPVSLFVEPDSGRLNLEEGVTYAVEEGGAGSARVIAWTHDGLVYYLVTRCAASCESARTTLDAPQSLAGLAR